MKRSAQVAAERDPRGSAATGVTFLNCDVPEAVRIGLDAAMARTSRCSRPASADSSSNAD